MPTRKSMPWQARAASETCDNRNRRQKVTDAPAEPPPKTEFPAATKARTNVGPPTLSPTDRLGPLPTPITSGGHGDTSRSPDKPQASTSLANRRPSGPTPRSGHSRPCRQFRQAMKPEHSSGAGAPPVHLRRATAHFCPLPSPPAITAFPATDEARTHFGRLPSSPIDGLRAYLAPTTFGNGGLTAPMEPRHTSGARPPPVHLRRVTDHRCPLLPSLPLPADLTLPPQQDAPLPS